MMTKETSARIISTCVPTLEGYNYSDDVAHEARRNKKLLTIRVELSHICNLQCIYCNEGNVSPQSDNISFETIKDVIYQVKKLGGQSVVIIGGGEPTIYTHFKELVLYISKKGMIPVVFTNGLTMNKDMAKFLLDNNSSTILKMDSQKEDVQDKLAGKKGVFKSIQNALNHLISIGYTKKSGSKLKLGLSFVTTVLNIDEIPNLWRFCRDNNIYPNHELLIPRGRAEINNIDLQPTKGQIIELKQELLRIDNMDYGYNWLPYKPLTSSGCLQVFYSIYLTTEGYVRPCADIDIKDFNVKNHTIAQIIDMDFFKLIRDVDKHLEGKCKDCEYGYECIGCRGFVYTVAFKKGCNPYKAIIGEDPLCWKCP